MIDDEIWQEVGNGTPSCRKLYVTDGIVGPGAPSSSVNVGPTLEGDGTPDEPLNVVGLNSPAGANITAAGEIIVSASDAVTVFAAGLGASVQSSIVMGLIDTPAGTHARVDLQSGAAIMLADSSVTMGAGPTFAAGVTAFESGAELALTANKLSTTGLTPAASASAGGSEAAPLTVAGYLPITVEGVEYRIPLYLP